MARVKVDIIKSVNSSSSKPIIFCGLQSEGEISKDDIGGKIKLTADIMQQLSEGKSVDGYDAKKEIQQSGFDFSKIDDWRLKSIISDDTVVCIACAHNNPVFCSQLRGDCDNLINGTAGFSTTANYASKNDDQTIQFAFLIEDKIIFFELAE